MNDGAYLFLSNLAFDFFADDVAPLVRFVVVLSITTNDRGVPGTWYP